MSVDFTAAAARDELTRDEADSPMFATQPVYARPTKRRSTSAFGAIPPVALVGIPVALVAIGAAAYFVLAPSDNSTVGLTPGSPAPVVAMAPAIPPAPMTSPLDAASEPAALAAATPAPVAVTPPVVERAAAPAARREAPVRVARARPAPVASDSALSSGEDASATLPAGPQPYGSLTRAPGEAPPAVAPPVNPAPTDPAVTQSTTGASESPEAAAATSAAIPEAATEQPATAVP